MRIRTLTAAAAVAAFSIALGGCGASPGNGAGSAGSADAGPTTISIGNPGLNPTMVPLLVGDQEGIFARHGIKTSYITFTSGAPMTAALASGSLDVALQGVQNIAGPITRGTKLEYFCGDMPHNKYYVLVAADSPLRGDEQTGGWRATFQQLAGKKVGVPVAGSGQQLQIMAALKEAGMDPGTVHFVGVGVGAPAQAALEHRQVDVLMGYDYFAQELVSEGSAKILSTVGTGTGPTAFNAYGYGFAASAKWLDAHAKQASDFCAAVGDAITFVASPANQGKIDAILTNQFKVSAASLESARASTVSSFSTDLPKDLIEAAIEISNESGAIPSGKTLTYDDVVWKPGK